MRLQHGANADQIGLMAIGIDQQRTSMRPQLEEGLFRTPSLRPGESASAPLPPLGGSLKVVLVWPQFPPSFWGFERLAENAAGEGRNTAIRSGHACGIVPAKLGTSVNRS